MKPFKSVVNEGAKSDHKLAKKAFNKFPSNQKRVINKLEDELNSLKYDDSPETLMSRDYGTLSPLEHNVIDKAQIAANTVFKDNDKLLKILNPSDKYMSSPPEDNFIMNLWDLYT